MSQTPPQGLRGRGRGLQGVEERARDPVRPSDLGRGRAVREPPEGSCLLTRPDTSGPSPAAVRPCPSHQHLTEVGTALIGAAEQTAVLLRLRGTGSQGGWVNEQAGRRGHPEQCGSEAGTGDRDMGGLGSRWQPRPVRTYPPVGLRRLPEHVRG